jgi:hypothetical protein
VLYNFALPLECLLSVTGLPVCEASFSELLIQLIRGIVTNGLLLLKNNFFEWHLKFLLNFEVKFDIFKACKNLYTTTQWCFLKKKSFRFLGEI